MGNQATKVSEQASTTASSIKKRLTIRRRRPDIVSDFTPEDIQKKFDGIPVLTEQEKKVLKSSWTLIVQKIEIVRLHFIVVRRINISEIFNFAVFLVWLRTFFKVRQLEMY